MSDGIGPQRTHAPQRMRGRLGSASTLSRWWGGALNGLLGDSQWADIEQIYWTERLRIWQRMGRDHMVGGLLRSIELPIEQGTFTVRPPADATELEQRVTELVEQWYLRAIDWKLAVRAALTALQYGFSVLEQEWELRAGMWELAGLWYRPQHTILDDVRDQAGDLVGLTQFLPHGGVVTLPREKLCLWSVGSLGAADWTGRSILEPSYKAWLLKDQAERITAIGHQRWSAGIPMIRALLDSQGRPFNVDEQERAKIEQVLRGLEVNSEAYLYVPGGFEAGMLDRNVQATTPLEWVRHLDRSIALSMLATHLVVIESGGGGTGPGKINTSSISDVFLQVVKAIGDEWCSVVQQQSIEPLVRANWGPTVRPPILGVRSTYQASVYLLGYLVQSGIVLPSEQLERLVYGILGVDYVPGERRMPDEVIEVDRDEEQEEENG